MAKTQPGNFIQSFHKWSGIFLVLFVTLKIISGYIISGALAPFDISKAYLIHYAKWVDIPLLFLFIFHAIYGILKGVTKFRTRNKPSVFWLTTLLATVLFTIMIVFIYFV